MQGTVLAETELLFVIVAAIALVEMRRVSSCLIAALIRR
jgi:hypothetical protein